MAKYNITEKKEKAANYRNQVRADLMDELYENILQKMVVEKKYRDVEYSAKVMAEELGTNTRYISAVINQRFQKNYSSLVNEYRIREATYMLVDKRYADNTIEEISNMVGFANRQSFYAAFYRMKGMTPREYREAHSTPAPQKKK